MCRTNGFRDDFFEKLQGLLDGFVEKKICAGASIIVGRFGQIAARYETGWADMEGKVPLCENTLFQMYSLTKPVTAVAVMQLWEKGCFQLTDPVSKYIPAYANVKVCHTAEDGREYLLAPAKPITIRDLLTMTGGICYDGPGLVGKGIKDLSECMIQSRADGKPWDTVAFANHLAKVPLLSEPSRQYKYSLGFDVLGALVEIWSGKPLDQYCQEYIFDPLGMKSTTFLITEAKNLATSYEKGEDGGLIPRKTTATPIINSYTFDNTSYMSGGSGLICTLDDYFRFAKMLAKGGKTDSGASLLSEESLKIISSPQLTEHQLQTFAQPGDTCLHAEGYSYGYGVHVMKNPKNHIPVGEWGWAGTMGTWMSIDPKTEVFWVYAHQMVPAGYESYIPELSKLIYSSLKEM